MQTFRERRDAMGLTQKELADRLGVRSNTVARWERGVRPTPASAEKCFALLEALTEVVEWRASMYANDMLLEILEDEDAETMTPEQQAIYAIGVQAPAEAD